MRSASDGESLLQHPSLEPRDIALLDTHGDRLLAHGVAHSGLHSVLSSSNGLPLGPNPCIIFKQIA